MFVVILVIGIWSTVACVTGRLLFRMHRSGVFRLRTALLWVMAGLAFGAVYLRPHEDIFGGQDQGAYLNAAVTFARTKTLKHVDPLLVAVPEAQRAEFHYRSSRSGLPTLTHVLRLESIDSARQVPWFQPGFSLLLALPALVGFPAGCLLVTPVVTILAGLSLMALSLALWPGRRGHAVSLLTFLLMPLVVWHGRNARAEVAASYFLVSGVALLAHWLRGHRVARMDAVLAGLCLGVAPLFHLMALPLTALLCATLVVRIGMGGYGRRDALLYGVFVGGALFGVQTVWVADPYRLRALVTAPLTVACVVAAVVLLLGVGWLWRRVCRPVALQRRGRAAVTVAWILGGLCLALLVFRQGSMGGRGVFSSGFFLHVLGLVDMPGFVHIVRIPLALTALAGWCLWIVQSRDDRLSRTVALSAFICSLMGGVVVSSLGYTSRYMMLYLAPSVSLCLTAVVMAGQELRNQLARWCTNVAMGLVALSCAWAIYVQWPMVVERDYPGYAAFVQRAAQPLRGGLVLCESSRIATAFKHLVGLDVLGIDTASHRDYAGIEAGWQCVMVRFPERPAFFVTPFAAVPLSERFDFEACGAYHYEGERLRSSATAMNERSTPLEKRLFVYRMRPPVPRADAPTAFTRDIPMVGSMGLRRFHTSRMVSPNQEGVRVPTSPSVPLRVDALREVETSDPVGLVLVSDKAPRLVGREGVSIPVHPLRAPWWLAVGTRTALDAGLSIASADSPVYLVDCWRLGPVARPLAGWMAGQKVEAIALPAVRGRWMAQGAEILLPERSAGTLFAVLIKVSPADEALEPHLRLTVGNQASRAFALEPSSGKLRWYFIHDENQEISGPSQEWVRMAMNPPYRVQRRQSSVVRVGVLAGACSLPLTSKP